jgi:Transposase and inactivated derivatives
MGGKARAQDRGPIHMDEVIVKVNGEKLYRRHAKDKKTRFKFSGNLTDRSYERGAKPLFKQIKRRTRKQFKERKKMGNPIKFVSDKLGHYRKGFNRYFSRMADLEFGVPIANKKYGREHNNNPIERDNEEIKERYKVIRGFKNKDSAQTTLDMHDIHQNYIHPIRLKGEKSGRTPAEGRPV